MARCPTCWPSNSNKELNVLEYSVQRVVSRCIMLTCKFVLMNVGFVQIQFVYSVQKTRQCRCFVLKYNE